MGWFKRNPPKKRQVDVKRADVVVECTDKRYELTFEGDYFYQNPLDDSDEVMSAREVVRTWLKQAHEVGMLSVGPRDDAWFEYVPLRKVERISIMYEPCWVEVEG